MLDQLCSSGLLAERDAARFLRHGHFAYEGGDHGDTGLSLELLFADPARLQRAAGRLAQGLPRHGASLVCGPLIGGALVGQWIARELGLRFVYAEPEPGPSAAGRRYAIPPGLRGAMAGERVLLVDDVINAGSATLACVRDIESLGGRTVAVACLIVRESTVKGLGQRLGLPIEALLAVPWNTWAPSDCPLCRSGVVLSPS